MRFREQHWSSDLQAPVNGVRILEELSSCRGAAIYSEWNGAGAGGLILDAEEERKKVSEDCRLYPRPFAVIKMHPDSIENSKNHPHIDRSARILAPSAPPCVAPRSRLLETAVGTAERGEPSAPSSSSHANPRNPATMFGRYGRRELWWLVAWLFSSSGLIRSCLPFSDVFCCCWLFLSTSDVACLKAGETVC